MTDQKLIELDAALNDFHEQYEHGIWPDEKIDEIIKIANDVPGWESKVKDFEAYCDQLYANFNNENDPGSSQFVTGNFGLNVDKVTMKLPSKPDVNTENVSSYSIFGREVFSKTKKVTKIANDDTIETQPIATLNVEENGEQLREKLEDNVAKVLENQLIIMACLEDIKKSLKDITDRVTNLEKK